MTCCKLFSFTFRLVLSLGASIFVWYSQVILSVYTWSKRGNLEDLATARGHSPWNSLLDSLSLNTEVVVMAVVKWTRLHLAPVPATVLDLLNPSGCTRSNNSPRLAKSLWQVVHAVEKLVINQFGMCFVDIMRVRLQACASPRIGVSKMVK